MNKHHHVQDVTLEDGILRLTVDNRIIHTDIRDISMVLAKATEEELRFFEITPSGYGLHWPLLDEDISIDGLLNALPPSHFFSTTDSESPSSLAFRAQPLASTQTR
jgi:hypothetical protein